MPFQRPKAPSPNSTKRRAAPPRGGDAKRAPGVEAFDDIDGEWVDVEEGEPEPMRAADPMGDADAGVPPDDGAESGGGDEFGDFADIAEEGEAIRPMDGDTSDPSDAGDGFDGDFEEAEDGGGSGGGDLGAAPASGRRPWFRWALAALAGLAAIFSAYLVWKWTKGESDGLAGCAGDDCSKVLDSHWSRVFSIPVSLLGLALYVPMVASSFFIASRFARNVRSAAWSALTAGATMALLGAAYFIYLMKARIGATCPYCLAVHLTGSLFGALVLWRRFSLTRRKAEAMIPVATGAMAVAALVMVQSVSEPKPTHNVVEIDPATVNGGGAAQNPASSPAMGDQMRASEKPKPPKKEGPTLDVAALRSSADSTGSFDALRQDPVLRQVPTEDPEPEKFAPADPPNTGIGPARPEDQAGPPKPKPGGSFALPGQEDYPNSAPDPQPAPAPGPAPFRPTGEKPDPAPAAVAGNASTRVAPAERIVNFFDGSLALPVHDLPIIGRPDAEHIMVELFDYTCDHCREFYPALLMAKLRYGDQIAIVLLPTPLNSKCNQYLPEGQFDRPDACEYARYALAVFRADRDKFPLFHDWLIKVEPLPSEARDYAAELVGKPAFDRALADGWVGETLKRGTALYGDLAKTNRKLPKLVLGGSKVMQGLPQDVRTLFAVIESSVPVTPVQAQTQP